MGQGCDFRTQAYLQEGPTIDFFAGRSELGADVVCCKAVPWCRREEGRVNFHLLSVRHRRLDESKKIAPLQSVSTRSRVGRDVNCEGAVLLWTLPPTLPTTFYIPLLDATVVRAEFV
jgi:hypothetical protein